MIPQVNFIYYADVAVIDAVAFYCLAGHCYTFLNTLKVLFWH